jgi:hypothetical protein
VCAHFKIFCLNWEKKFLLPSIFTIQCASMCCCANA